MIVKYLIIVIKAAKTSIYGLGF